MYWSTMCSSETGPWWDLYVSTSSEVGTYLERKSDVHANIMKDSQLVESGCKERLLYQPVKPKAPTEYRLNRKEESSSAPESEIPGNLCLSAPVSNDGGAKDG